MSVKVFLLSCLLQASSTNNLDPKLVASVIGVEGGSAGLVSVNKNGSEDLGIMQINDKVWLPIVSKALFKGDENKARYALINDPCFNIKVGSWILSRAIKEADGDVYKGVGFYHSHNEKYANEYANKVLKYKKNHFGD